MLSFKNREWRSVYRSGDQHILNEFYVPALSAAVMYDRAVGFFSSTVLAAALTGLYSFVKNDGRMRLVIGAPLSPEEFAAIKNDASGSAGKAKLEAMWTSLIEDQHQGEEADLKTIGATALGFLVKSGRAEVRFALRHQGMYHEKIGILEDGNGDRLVFSGSANETVYGLNPEYNAESITVYKSWDAAVFSSYGAEFIEGFEALWEGRQKSTITLDIHSELYEEIASRCEAKTIEEFVVLDDLYSAYQDQLLLDSLLETNPTIPLRLGGQKFEIRDHQIRAIQEWQKSQFKGILQLSTGSGKTITSIYAAVKIFEQRKARGWCTILIIAVPYIELAEQWAEVLALFNVHPHKVWGSSSAWSTRLRDAISTYRLSEKPRLLPILAVNASLSGDAFAKIKDSLPLNETIFIGDECHNHGGVKISKALPEAAYRMGLSATPFSSEEDEMDSPFPDYAKNRLIEYYGGVVFEFSILDAISQDILCQYEYHIVPVFLNDEEQELYDALSSEISSLMAAIGCGPATKDQRDRLNIHASKRARLLGSASGKLSELRRLAKCLGPNERKKTLVYCGEGRRLESDGELADQKTIAEISKILGEAGWKTTRFTSEEGAAERRRIMEAFREEDIDALVSMRVLDEGVDVPDCDTAIITASTRNRRQFVQRRGRVLRKSEGKQIATIYDFVTLPNPNADSKYGSALMKAELERVDDFCAACANKLEVETEIDRLGLRDV